MTAPNTARVNGIDISYSVAGSGPLVVMVMGTGSPGRVWKANQEPALVKAGHTVVTFDNRGIARRRNVPRVSAWMTWSPTPPR